MGQQNGTVLSYVLGYKATLASSEDEISFPICNTPATADDPQPVCCCIPVAFQREQNFAGSVVQRFLEWTLSCEAYDGLQVSYLRLD